MLLYNVFMTISFLVSLGFFIFISLGSKKKDGNFEEQKKLISWVNMEEEKVGAVRIRPSKWYNKFTEQ